MRLSDSPTFWLLFKLATLEEILISAAVASRSSRSSIDNFVAIRLLLVKRKAMLIEESFKLIVSRISIGSDGLVIRSSIYNFVGIVGIVAIRLLLVKRKAVLIEESIKLIVFRISIGFDRLVPLSSL